ncbi:hypothetical protein Nepgr_017468 [Nepenthes gracilis]|uniref:Uncharacterized protein n=1 Tax=Nepenthes gracilis TaxID=150966 RepID=A0AAD3XS67_NEPGR|nr:hypothetical protein Nepgr_017468 [Nepenthes gracilis]
MWRIASVLQPRWPGAVRPVIAFAAILSGRWAASCESSEMHPDRLSLLGALMEQIRCSWSLGEDPSMILAFGG